MLNRITLEQTDHDLPKHVKNGFMRYRDFEPLTRGGEAMLQTCFDENLGRTVVMKTLLPHLSDMEVYRRRFLREARVSAQIPHPATPPVYEISRDREGSVYFTMKKLSGRDLCEILDEIAEGNEETKKKYPLDILISVLIRIGQCLDYAHDLGVVHRDLKPGNIMVGEYGEVTLLDWGLAKVIGAPDNDEVETLVRSGQQNQKVSGRLTGRGDVQGTPFYMSPEQARETADVDGRTDIYNMGIILFEMLTNESFMSGRNFKEIKRKILEDPLREAIDVAPRGTVPVKLNAICSKALAKDVSERYQSMGDLVQDLRNYLLGRDVSVYDQSSFSRLVPLGWIAVGAAVATVVQLIWQSLN